MKFISKSAIALAMMAAFSVPTVSAGPNEVLIGNIDDLVRLKPRRWRLLISVEPYWARRLFS
jgi:hypothetical protein